MRRFLNRTYGAVIIVFLFCIGLNMLIWYNHDQQLEADRKTSVQAAIQRNSNLVLALEQYTIKTIQNADAILKVVKMEFGMQGKQINVSKLMQRELLNADNFSGLAVMDKSGFIISSNVSSIDTRSLNFRDRSYFQFHSNNASDTLIISRPMMSKTIHQPIIALSRRLENPDGSFAGVVVVQVTPPTFTRFYEGAYTNDRDIISLIAPDGITYARRTGPVDGYGEDISKSPLFTHVAKNPVGSYFAKDAIKGVPTYFSFRRLKDYPIIATAGVAEDDVLAAYYQRASRDRTYTTVISILIILFSVLVSLGFLYRKKSLQRLRASEVKYRSMFHNSNDAIILMKPDGSIIDHNLSASRVFRFSAGQNSDLNFKQLTGTDFSLHFIVEQVTPQTINYNGEHEFIRTDGTKFTGEIASSLYNDSDGQPNIIAIIRDNSERKLMEARLFNEKKRRNQVITRQVILGQERVRETIGRELHDNVNQVLTTVKLYLDLVNKDATMYPQLVPKSIRLIDRSIQDIRNLSHDLSAPTLGTRSLIDAIFSLLDAVQLSSGLKVHFCHRAFIETIDMELKLAVYRIIQEQLNNVVKHASAKTVVITLKQCDDNLELMIKDDGQGFDATMNRKGIGINNMIGRARAFSGVINIDSATGNGCTLTAVFPLHPLADEQAGSFSTPLNEV